MSIRCSFRLSTQAIVFLSSFALFSGTASANERTWPEAMTQVHGRFRGRSGTFAQFGDSITVSMAFWSALQGNRRNMPPEMERAYVRVAQHLLPECWRDWRGPEFGNEGGRTVRWAEENVATWLQKLNPEVALVMFGTNDLTSLEVNEYRDRLRTVVRRCLDNGTVVILSTIPPRHGYEEKTKVFADAAREVARELAVPLVDYHAEILKRRPNDWDGSLEQFGAYDGYDVPTLISRDGVHPSAPKGFEGDFSAKALRSHGYALRNYLVLVTYAEVIGEAVYAPEQPWFPKAERMPSPSGDVIRVADARGLTAAVRKVKPGGTILLDDGITS